MASVRTQVSSSSRRFKEVIQVDGDCLNWFKGSFFHTQGYSMLIDQLGWPCNALAVHLAAEDTHRGMVWGFNLIEVGFQDHSGLGCGLIAVYDWMGKGF